MVVGELHALPHLVELPARGVGADMIGRAGALLVDIAIDTVPRGYRLVPGRGAVTKRAISLLGEDIDALEEAWEKAGPGTAGRVVKVQAPGPITLAAQLELGGGTPGASPTLAPSGTSRPRSPRAWPCTPRRSPGGSVRPVVVQYDEPLLPAALAGRLTGVTTLNPVHPVDEALAVELFDVCAAAGGDVAVHCCAADIPWKMLQRSTVAAVSVDVTTLTAADLDGLGEFVESGRTVLLGVVPAHRTVETAVP